MSNFDYVLGVAAAGLDDLHGGDMENHEYGNGYYSFNNDDDNDDDDDDDYDYDDDLDFDNDHALGPAGSGHQPFLDDQYPELASEPLLPAHSASPVPWSDDLSDSDTYEEDRDDDDLDTTVSLDEEDLPDWGDNRPHEWVAGSGSGSGSDSDSGHRSLSAGGSAASLSNISGFSSPSPPPYPAAAIWPESVSRGSSVSSSASNLVDSDVSYARSPAPPAASASGASSPASASSGSNSAPQHWRPQGQQPPVRQRVGLQHPRASPRRPSLTPTIHPNRRLPRPANLHQPRQPNHHSPRHRRVSPSIDDLPASVYDHSDFLLSSQPPSSDPDDLSPPVRASSSYDIPRASGGGGGGGSGSGSGSGFGANARSPRPQQESLYSGLAHQLSSESEEDSQAAIRQQSRLQPSRNRLAARESQEAFAPSPGIPWASDFDWGSDMDIDDELIEIIVDRDRHGHHQAPSAQEQRQQRQHRDQQQRRRHQTLAHPRQPMQGASSGNLERQDAAGVDVIDLTEEPDSPVLLHHRPVNLRRNAGPDHANQQQNPRRQTSQAGRTPSLARSDGSILGHVQPAAAVIDLTSNSDEDLDIPLNRRLPAPVPAASRDNRRSVEFAGLRHYMPALAGLGNLSRITNLFPGLVAARLGAHDAEVQIIGTHQFAMNANPLAGNQPEFNYQGNGFGGRQPPPKPEFQPPPPARPGFTRDTGLGQDTNEEMVIVCASCDNELRYSNNDEDDGDLRPAKRPRNKKDREEHHFWAVKTCGHVYCKHCYDNRKKTKSKDYEKLGFQVDTSHRVPKIFCAVDQCNSDVTSTQVWVGIFM